MSEDKNKPNIFKYATKELSQDAVICWLIEWSSYDGQGHEKLRECGQQFVKALFAKHDDKKVPENYGKPEIWQQDNNIDVLTKIGEYVLLIEDKTDTGDHSSQLERYYQLVLRGQTQAGHVDNGNILPIYLKTGNQSLFDHLRIENVTPYPYKVFNRCDLLKVVEPYKGTHPILDDFRDHLKSLEDDTQSYREWREDGNGEVSYRSFEGFFRELESQLCVLNSDSGLVGFDNKDSAKPTQNTWRPNCHPFWGWGWVANPAGGFFGFWWYYKTVESCDIDVDIYLQLEIKPDKPGDGKLCFKADASGLDKKQSPNVDLSRIKHDCHDRILNADNGLLRKPDRMRTGNTMTVAQWDVQYSDGQKQNPWLVFNSNGGPDIQATVKNLMEAQSVLDNVY